MSKVKKQKALFPFSLLQHWFKPLRTDASHLCSCGNVAVSACENYIDVFQFHQLIASGTSDKFATNIIWGQSLTSQCQGIYTNYGSTYHCHDCMMRVLTISVGEHAANLAIMPSLLMGVPVSVIVGSRLTTPQDDGLTFASTLPPSVSTIEHLSRLLHAKAVDIHLK